MAICWHTPPTDADFGHHPRGGRTDPGHPLRRGSPAGCRTNRGRCLTHDLWEELGNQIHLYLSSVTVADVCERRVLGSSHVMLPDAVGEPRAEVRLKQPSRFGRTDLTEKTLED